MAARLTVVAKVLVLNPQGELLLLQRSASDPRRPLQWDIPGGHTDGDEFAEEAAARETLEEAGITLHARALQLVKTRTTLVEPGHSVSWLFYLGHTSQTEVILSSEHQAFQWVLPAHALEFIEYEVQRELLDYVINNIFK